MGSQPGNKIGKGQLLKTESYESMSGCGKGKVRKPWNLLARVRRNLEREK